MRCDKPSQKRFGNGISEQVGEQVDEQVGQQVGQQVDEQDLCFSKCIVCGPAPVSAVIPDLFLLSSQTCFFCHPGLDPGSTARRWSLQRAVVRTGSRIFARDDKCLMDVSTSPGRINSRLVQSNETVFAKLTA
jgi:hypothetical protein